MCEQEHDVEPWERDGEYRTEVPIVFLFRDTGKKVAACTEIAGRSARLLITLYDCMLSGNPENEGLKRI